MPLAIIQARMRSSRLPGKVLIDICGKSMLQRVIERVKQAKLVTDIVVATSTNSENNAIEQECKRLEITCFRAPYEDNVLSRFYTCALKYIKTDPIIRITADCPLVDPQLINEAILKYKSGEWDFITTSNGFPDGMDIEVFSIQLLSEAWHKAITKEEKEHVCIYMYNSSKFRIKRMECRHNVPKLSVDTQKDLNRVIEIYQKFGDFVNLDQIIEYYSLAMVSFRQRIKEKNVE